MFPVIGHRIPFSLSISSFYLRDEDCYGVMERSDRYHLTNLIFNENIFQCNSEGMVLAMNIFHPLMSSERSDMAIPQSSPSVKLLLNLARHVFMYLFEAHP
ncbi:hypothetical protein O6H91_Y484800 [Diphasiastrum complanatum]|nr:hypothetical protein O6H91_Y484800 [Diphasiastrum complanatum]